MSNRPGFDRRRFLRRTRDCVTSAVAFPYVVPSSVLGGYGAAVPGNKIAVGCIGLGIRGNQLLQAFLPQKDVRVVAVCDVNGKQRDRAKSVVDRHYGDSSCVAHSGFRDLCSRPDLDAVCIASPDHWHVLHSLEAVRNGKDIYTEKALGLPVCDVYRDGPDALVHAVLKLKKELGK